MASFGSWTEKMLYCTLLLIQVPQFQACLNTNETGCGNCPPHCLGDRCNITTRSCVDGCKTGYLGDTCTHHKNTIVLIVVLLVVSVIISGIVVGAVIVVRHTKQKRRATITTSTTATTASTSTTTNTDNVVRNPTPPSDRPHTHCPIIPDGPDYLNKCMDKGMVSRHPRNSTPPAESNFILPEYQNLKQVSTGVDTYTPFTNSAKFHKEGEPIDTYTPCSDSRVNLAGSDYDYVLIAKESGPTRYAYQNVSKNQQKSYQKLLNGAKNHAVRPASYTQISGQGRIKPDVKMSPFSRSLPDILTTNVKTNMIPSGDKNSKSDGDVTRPVRLIAVKYCNQLRKPTPQAPAGKPHSNTINL